MIQDHKMTLIPVVILVKSVDPIWCVDSFGPCLLRDFTTQNEARRDLSAR